MTDEIKLPPMSDIVTDSYSCSAMRDYARLAVEQDRARREVKKAPERATVSLMANGGALYGYRLGAQHEVVLRWTPERVWIDSDRNRELARMLRDYHYRDAADALDGGER